MENIVIANPEKLEKLKKAKKYSWKELNGKGVRNLLL